MHHVAMKGYMEELDQSLQATVKLTKQGPEIVVEEYTARRASLPLGSSSYKVRSLLSSKYLQSSMYFVILDSFELSRKGAFKIHKRGRSMAVRCELQRIFSSAFQR